MWYTAHPSGFSAIFINCNLTHFHHVIWTSHRKAAAESSLASWVPCAADYVRSIQYCHQRLFWHLHHISANCFYFLESASKFLWWIQSVPWTLSDSSCHLLCHKSLSFLRFPSLVNCIHSILFVHFWVGDTLKMWHQTVDSPKYSLTCSSPHIHGWSAPCVWWPIGSQVWESNISSILTCFYSMREHSEPSITSVVHMLKWHCFLRVGEKIWCFL